MSLVKPFIRPLPFGFQRPLDIQNETDSHSLNTERAAVRSIGGTPNLVLKGPDGHTNGFIQRPIEIKYASKDFRFRIGEKDHKQMLRENGIYIFVNANGHQRRMTAQQANSLLAYDWMQDRAYPHSFIFVKDVFR